MFPSFTRKFFSLLILGCSLLLSFFFVSYLTLTAAVPLAPLGDFSIYLERMFGVSPITGAESGQVKNAKLFNNQLDTYYQKLIGNCGGGYILSVNWDGTVVCGSPAVPLPPPAFTCAARPAYTNTTFFDGTPTIANQPWSQIGPNCKYTCTGGYSGVDCSIAPVGNSCAALPACTTYGGCTTVVGTPTSIGQAWDQIGPNCKYTCTAGYAGPTCTPLGASSCLSYSETWSGSGQGGNCSALIPAGFSVSDNQPLGTSPTISLMNTAVGYSGSVTWKCIDSDPVVGTTAVEWVFAGGSCSAVPHCSATLPTCDGVGCTITVGTPISANQDWSRGASSCGFTCNPGYSGVNCEIPPSGGNCGTFSCFAREQAGGWDVACWNNFKFKLDAWLAAGYITPAQRTQIEIDGDVSWDATCGQIAAAKATVGGFYRNSILTSLPVTGVFTLDTEEFALFGGCSIDAAVACPALPPSAPTGLTGVAGNASVALSWTAPSGIIGDYIVEYKTTAGATWLVFNDGVGTGTTANVTGLTNGISYDFRVKARNGNGDSGPSNVVSSTPIGGGICITENWGPGCGSTMPVSSPIVDNGIGPIVTITNTNPGFTGSVQMRCYDGDPVLGNIAYETIVGSGSCTPLTVDACGTAQTTGSTEYPVGAAACTSGAQTDVDINGFDNTYNWNCGALSCSAAVLPHCEVVHTIVWVTETDTLSVGSTSPSYAISTTQPGKFNASCSGRGGATCTDIDPSPTRGEFACTAVAPPTITWEYGCFVAGTQVTLDSGKTKSIEDIEVGEKVRTYDEVSKTYIDRPVTETFHHAERLQKLYTFEYGDQILTSNHIHRIYLPINDTYISAEEIYKKWKNGEEIYFLDDQTHTPVQVHKIQVENKVVPVYNLHVSGIHDRDDTLIDYTLPNHNYIANGVVVHNAKAPNTMADGIALFNTFNTNCTNAGHGILFQNICMADSTSIMASNGSPINGVVCYGTAVEQIAIDACRLSGGLTWVNKGGGCRNTTLYTITGDPQTEYENYEINPSCSVAGEYVLVGAADKYGFCPVGSRGAESYRCE